MGEMPRHVAEKIPEDIRVIVGGIHSGIMRRILSIANDEGNGNTQIKELDFSILKTLVFQKLETEGNVSRLLGWVGVDYESQSAQNGQPQEEFKKRIILLQLFHKSEIGEWY